MPALNPQLQQLLLIRLFVFLCQLSAVAVIGLFVGIALPYLPVLTILGVFLLVNVALWLRLRSGRPVSEPEFLLHLLMDIGGLFLLMYFTGGAANPFVSYLLVPLMIAATTLSAPYTWGVAGAALLAYSALLFFYIPLPDLMPGGGDMAAMGSDGEGLSLHIFGMWANFLVSAVLITGFVVRMATNERRQRAQIASLRETTLRNEQILAIATQAATTAHELGTPLSTMAVMLEDMKQEQAGRDGEQQLSILIQQVSLCRQILQKLVTSTDASQSQSQCGLGDFIDDLIDHWQLLRPEARLEFSRSEAEQHCVLPATEGLQQAIINLLNNAADAGDNRLAMVSEVDAEQWTLTLTDSGPGLTDELKQQLGLQVASTKQQGLGVGYMLSHATLERLGGSVSMEDADGPDGKAGTITRIHVPVRQQP